MSSQWKRDREQLLSWANEKEQKKSEGFSFGGISTGNLSVAVGGALAAVVGIYFYSSNGGKSVEAQLGASDEEIDVEEEYSELEYSD